MRLLTAAVLIVASLAPAVPAARAQERTDLQTEMRQKRFVVLPKPDPGQVSQDVDRAVDVLTARRRDEMVREPVAPHRRRPDLGYDITGTIQQRNLETVRRR
jgi:hypothetical protein